MTYAIIDRIKDGDSYEQLFATYVEARDKADAEWSRLSEHDKRRREYYAVMSGELDEDGCFDLNTAKELTAYRDTTGSEYRELRVAALSPVATAGDRLALYEWMEQNCMSDWNGECFDIDDRYELWPVYDDDEAEDAELIDAEVRYR